MDSSVLRILWMQASTPLVLGSKSRAHTCLRICVRVCMPAQTTRKILFLSLMALRAASHPGGLCSVQISHFRGTSSSMNFGAVRPSSVRRKTTLTALPICMSASAMSTRLVSIFGPSASST